MTERYNTTKEVVITEEQQGALTSYIIHSRAEWAMVVIDPRHNLVMCYSGSGSYNYSWGSPGSSFIDFLVSLDYGYAMGKFLGSRNVLDVEKTAQNMREHILQARQVDSITAEVAREMWDHVKDAQEGLDVEFMMEIRDGVYGEHDHDWWERPIYQFPSEARWFWDEIWMPLMRYLRDKRGR